MKEKSKKEKATKTKYPQWVIDIAKSVETEGKALDMRAVSLRASNGIRDATSSGSLAIDLISGGGWAPGKVVSTFGPEQSGKTTDAYETIAYSLLEGTVCFLFDAEQATDVDYLMRIIEKVTGKQMEFFLGEIKDGKIVKPGLLYYIQPTTGEATFTMINRILKSAIPDVVKDEKKGWCWVIKGKTKNDYKLVPRDIGGASSSVIVIDSLVALVPEAKEKDDTSNPIGMQARMLSSQLPKVVNRCGRKRCVLLYTNQLRNKIGVMFGCLHGDTVLKFKDGGVHTIKEVVDNKIQGDILSYNKKTNTIEYKPIENWFYNGEVSSKEDWITIKTKGFETKNGVASVTVTRDHKIRTKEGWKKAESIKVGDYIMTPTKCIINDTLREFLVGTFCGDCTLSTDTRTNKTNIRLQNSEQLEYNEWKKDKLLTAFNISSCVQRNAPVYYTEPSNELTKWKNLIENRNPLKVEKYFTKLSLALLFMDDGHSRVNDGTRYTASISFGRFAGDEKTLMKLHSFFKRMGYDNFVICDEGLISFDKENYYKLSKDICRYVPPCMQYKLPKEYRGKYEDFNLKFKETYSYTYVPVIEAGVASDRKFRLKGKYDISVGDTHNYMAGSSCNGIIVHNSPETEPGGEAPRFYSSQRIRFGSISTSTVDKVFITTGVSDEGKGLVDEEPAWNEEGFDRYRYSKIKITKNKLFSPFQETFVRWRFEKGGQQGDGLDPSFDVYMYLYQTGQCSKKTGKGIMLSLLPKEEGSEFSSDILELFNGKKKKDKKKKKKEKKNKVESIDKRLSWLEFKGIVENPDNKTALRKHCVSQLRSGYAFSLYFASKTARRRE